MTEYILCTQLLQDELAERSVQLEKVKRAGRDLVSTDESPSLKAVDILCAAGNLIPDHRPPCLHGDMSSLSFLNLHVSKQELRT